jgi:hypothetical protein
MTNENNNEDVTEDFCAACVMLPVAMVGAGVAGQQTSFSSKRKSKRWIFWISVVLTTIILAITIWYFTRCSSCKR